jgi:hypothetical protein
MVKVSSDPHAHLRPIYRQLAADRSFSMLATETQFTRLVEAVSVQSERQAALMRQYSQPARARFWLTLQRPSASGRDRARSSYG